jgi:hypothetical protein
VPPWNDHVFAMASASDVPVDNDSLESKIDSPEAGKKKMLIQELARSDVQRQEVSL